MISLFFTLLTYYLLFLGSLALVRQIGSGIVALNAYRMKRVIARMPDEISKIKYLIGVMQQRIEFYEWTARVFAKIRFSYGKRDAETRVASLKQAIDFSEKLIALAEQQAKVQKEKEAYGKLNFSQIFANSKAIH